MTPSVPQPVEAVRDVVRRSRIKHPISRGPRPNYKRGALRALMWFAYIIAISAIGVVAELYFIERAHASSGQNRHGVVANVRWSCAA